MASFNRSNPELSLTQALNRCYSHLEKEYALSRIDIVHEKEFMALSEKLLGKKFDYKNLSTMDVAPVCDPFATRAQQINCHINKIRNQHLVSIIHQSFTKNDNILVVYGAGHLVQIDLSIRSFMDKI
jgi:hypothetical protein